MELGQAPSSVGNSFHPFQSASSWSETSSTHRSCVTTGSSKAAGGRSAIGFVTYLDYVERLKGTASHLGKACASYRRHSGFADEARPRLGTSCTKRRHDDFLLVRPP